MNKSGAEVIPEMNSTEKITSMDDDELIWVISRSLLSLSKHCTEGVTTLNLLQYQTRDRACDLECEVTERHIEEIKTQIERSVEELTLAQEALEELDQRTN